MGLFPDDIAEKIADKIFRADMSMRRMFHAEAIVSENDYTSKLTYRIATAFEDEDQIAVTSQNFRREKETEFGADACIVLINKDTKKAKICLFEAKSLNRSNWDYRQNNISHFGSQLIRQHSIIKDTPYAIWEQFYLPFADGEETEYRNKIPLFGSLCIWHERAYRYYIKFLSKEKSLFNSYVIRNISDCYTMSDMILKVCACKEGKLIDSDEVYEYIPSVKYLLTLQYEEKAEASFEMAIY